MHSRCGHASRIILLLVTPCACDGSMPLGDKGLIESTSGGSGTSHQGGASVTSSGFGGTQASSGGAFASSVGGAFAGSTVNSAAMSASGGTTEGLVASGGSQAIMGGAANTGVSSGGTESLMGGASSLGSVSPTGGVSSGGGTSGTGGNPVGTSSTGGAPSSGGTAITGGALATGGNLATTGGASATAGTANDEPRCITSARDAYWKETTLTSASGDADVVVNDDLEQQTWQGFGGAFNELGWKYLVTPAMQLEAMQLLFGVNGCNFAWGRIPIGASDYAVSRYTLDDTVEPNDPVASGESARPPADTALDHWSFAREGQYLIPYVKAAQAVKPDLRFWASPWTPPVWMKTGYKTSSASGGAAKRPSYFDGGRFAIDNPAYLSTYAEYYRRFIEGYRGQGIEIEIVSPQNEPGYEQNYPSCLWDQSTYVSWVKTLGQAMKDMSVRLMLGTLSNVGDANRNDLNIANAVLADPQAMSLVSVVGVQWGALDALNQGASFGGLPVWATEHKCGNYPWNPVGYPQYNGTYAPNDFAYAVESWGYIRDAITKGRVTSYNAWNMVLDGTGLGNDTSRDWRQNTLLVADAGLVRTTPTYFVFRHLSQFAAPGAKVVGTTGGDAVAFKNPDGSIVAVLYNAGDARTSTVKIGSKSLQFEMPAAGWATVVSP